MKRRKKLWIMGGVLALVLVLTVSVALIDRKMEKIQESGELILEIPVDSVTALSWDHQGETLSFTKDETWHYTEDPDFPVSESAMNQLLYPFEQFSAAFVIEEVEDYGQYGLENPVCTIGMTAGDRDYTIRLGAFSKLDDQRYLDIGDGNVYLVFHDPMQEFDTDLRDVIANDRAPFLEEADKITFQGQEDYTILREPEGGKSYREEDSYFAKLDGELLPLDPAAVENYISDLTLVDLVNYQTYTVSQEDISVYGLDQPELTVAIDYTVTDPDTEESHPETYVLHLAREPESRAAFEAEQDPEKAKEISVPVYARVGDSEIIYEIRPQDYDRVMACGYDDLRHREIFPAKTEDITAVTAMMDGDTYVLESTREKEEDPRVFTYLGQEADVTEVLTALHSLHAEEFTEKAPAGQRELRLEITLKNQYRVVLELYRLDGEHCLASVDGKPVASLPRTQVVELKEKLNAIVLNPVEAPTEGTGETDSAQ